MSRLSKSYFNAFKHDCTGEECQRTGEKFVAHGPGRSQREDSAAGGGEADSEDEEYDGMVHGMEEEGKQFEEEDEEEDFSDLYPGL